MEGRLDGGPRNEIYARLTRDGEQVWYNYGAESER